MAGHEHSKRSHILCNNLPGSFLLSSGIDIANILNIHIMKINNNENSLLANLRAIY